MECEDSNSFVQNDVALECGSEVFDVMNPPVGFAFFVCLVLIVLYVDWHMGVFLVALFAPLHLIPQVLNIIAHVAPGFARNVPVFVPFICAFLMDDMTIHLRGQFICK